MSNDNGASVAASVVSVSLMDVLSPEVLGSGTSVLAKAKREMVERAGEELVELATTIMDVTKRKLTDKKTRQLALQAELDTIDKQISETEAYVAHANRSDAGLFALAAHTGLKANVQVWCQANGVVCPPNTDSVWSLPKAKTEA